MYEYVKKLANENIFDLTNMQENVHLIIYSLLAFFIPFSIGHPQFFVGTIVNAALIMSAFYLRGAKLLPVIMLPSLAVLSKGLIFGPFTPLLVYMIPLIWLGNTMIVLGFKRFYKKNKKNYFMTLFIAAGLKSLFLFSAALLFVKLSVLPAVFLTTMGLFQFYTAIAGGSISYAAVKYLSR